MEPLRDQSGLAANSVSFWQVMAQGLIANGPLAATTVALTAAASYALGALPLAYILGIVVVVLWVNTPWQFSKRLASASGVAYFVYQSMGGAYGYLAGLSYGTYYLALIPANALFFGVMIQALLPLIGIAHPAVWLWMPLSAAFLIPPLVITYRGIRTSLNYAIIIALTEVLLLLVVSLVIIAGAGPHNTTAVFNPGLAAGGMSGFAVGLLVAAFGMSGSTATVYLGSEARVPTETIRKGLIYSTLIVVVLFVLVSYAMTVGWGYQKMGQFAGANIPGLEVVQHYLGTVPELILGLFVINSLIGVNMAASIVVSRILMTFGRAGLMPTGWGQVHPVFKTPHQATVVLTVGAFLLGVVSAIVGALDRIHRPDLVGDHGRVLGPHLWEYRFAAVLPKTRGLADFGACCDSRAVAPHHPGRGLLHVLPHPCSVRVCSRFHVADPGGRSGTRSLVSEPAGQPRAGSAGVGLSGYRHGRVGGSHGGG